MKKPTHKKSHYKKIAEKYGVTAKEVENDITEAIKFAFDQPDGSSEKELLLKLFPYGKMPSNKDFINKLAMRCLGETED